MLVESLLRIVGTNRLAQRLREYVLRSSDASYYPNVTRPLTILVCRLDELASSELPRTLHGEVLHLSFWRSLLYVGPFWSPGTIGCGRCLLARVLDSPYGPDVDSTGRVVPPVFVG